MNAPIHSSRFNTVLVAALLGATLAACTSKEPPQSQDAGAAGGASADSSMSGMAGMPGMMDQAMMDSMQASMRTMAGMTPDQMAAALPTHRQMAANMLSQMTSDMRSMNMTADAAWTALIDSVRQDLIRMPEMTKAELGRAMAAHNARVTRLMEMHKGMMSKAGR